MKRVLGAVATFNRKAMVQRAITSWLETIPSDLWDLYIVDNGSTDGTAEWIETLAEGNSFIKAILLKENFGTAPALNLAWRYRKPAQHCVKADSDIVVNTPGFLERALKLLEVLPTIGIVGLRRKDLAERPDHPDPWLRSKLYAVEFPDEVIRIESCNHIIGSFTLYSAKALEKFGFLYQMQDERKPAYGYDDALACLRMHKLGYSTVFLRGWSEIEVDIDHIDPGEGNGSDAWNADYTKWKLEEATVWMPRYREITKEYLDGTRKCYYSAAQDWRALEGSIRKVVGEIS